MKIQMEQTKWGKGKKNSRNRASNKKNNNSIRATANTMFISLTWRCCGGSLRTRWQIEQTKWEKGKENSRNRASNKKNNNSIRATANTIFISLTWSRCCGLPRKRRWKAPNK
jgi:hypothetical protein